MEAGEAPPKKLGPEKGDDEKGVLAGAADVSIAPTSREESSK